MKQRFFDKFAVRFPTREYDDDDEDDFCALIVTDEMPISIINQIIQENANVMMGSRYVQLADTYENLPDFNNEHRQQGTEPNVAATWKSPFVGKSLKEIASWIRGIHKPPKAISKTCFTVLQKDLYEQQSEVLICRIYGGDKIKRIETIPMTASSFGQFVPSFRREDWRAAHDNQALW